MADLNFQLEALREIKTWNLWILAISGTIVTTSSVISFTSSIPDEHKFDAKISLSSGASAIFIAITTIYNIPAMIAKIPLIGKAPIDSASMLYGITLRHMTILSQAFVAVSGFFLLSIIWRIAFDHSFLDFKRKPAPTASGKKAKPNSTPSEITLQEAAEAAEEALSRLTFRRNKARKELERRKLEKEIRDLEEKIRDYPEPDVK